MSTARIDTNTLAQRRSTLVFLAILVALGPLSIDMYIPAMPAIQSSLGTTVASVHLTLSAYLAGFAIFHLFCGPLADRYGRIPLLSAGTVVFVLASLGCAAATRIEELVLFRFIQGVGACVGPTLARAMTRDLYGPRDAARALSLIAMIMALAPAVAPGLGGVVLSFAPWMTLFVFLALYGLLVLWIVRSKLVETLPQPQSLRPRNILKNYAQLMSDRRYIGVACGSALLYAGMMAYLASSGFIFIRLLGVPVQYFGLVFLTVVIGYMTGSALSARYSIALSSVRVLKGGLALAVLATALMAGLNTVLPKSVLALVLPVLLYSASLGLSLPNATALALESFPMIAATASSLFGFIQMGLSALVTSFVGPAVASSAAPLLWALVLINLSAATLVYSTLNVRKGGQTNALNEENQDP